MQAVWADPVFAGTIKLHIYVVHLSLAPKKCFLCWHNSTHWLWCPLHWYHWRSIAQLS